MPVTRASGRLAWMARLYAPLRMVDSVASTRMEPLRVTWQAASAPGSTTPTTGMPGWAAASAGKAAAVAAAVEGPVTSSLPGSAIQLHPHVTVVVDEAAASQLAHADYYRYAFANKPAWQGL